MTDELDQARAKRIATLTQEVERDILGTSTQADINRRLIAAMHRRDATFMNNQTKISRAIAAYEETRMGPRPKPKFILEIKDNYFYAKPSRATLWDAVFVAIATATWLALIASIYLVFK